MARLKWAGAIAGASRFVIVLAVTIPASGNLLADEASRPAKSDVPALWQVAAVHYVVLPDGEEKPKCEFTVMESLARNFVLAELSKIDWSQKGVKLSQIQLIRPDIEMTLIDIKGKKRRYAFYWKGDSFIDYNSGRLLQTNCSGFRQGLIRNLIRHFCKEQKSPTPLLEGTWRMIGYRLVGDPNKIDPNFKPRRLGRNVLMQITKTHLTQVAAHAKTGKILECAVSTYSRKGNLIIRELQYTTGKLPGKNSDRVHVWIAKFSQGRLFLTPPIPVRPALWDGALTQTVWERVK